MNASQNDLILRHMKERGAITPMDALREYGCMRLGARIYDLKRRGVPISSELVTGKNRDGDVVRYKRYWVKRNP